MSHLHVKIKRICFLITRKCNLWCKMCDYRIIHFTDKDLSLEQIKQMLDEAKELGLEWLDLTGGEPMMRKDIYEIISYAKSLGIKVSMCTNGTLIGEETAEKLIDAGLVTVVISLEGFKEIHDSLRGEGNYRKAIDAVRFFLRHKDRMEHIKVGMIISKKNYRELYLFTRYLFEEIGITSISYNPFTKWMLHVKKHDSIGDLIITEKLLPRLREELEKIIEFSKTSDGLFPNPSYFRKIPDYFSGVDLVPKRGCSLPLTICGIEADGSVFPCLMEHVPAGNIKETSFKEIITGKTYQDTCIRALTRKCEGCLSACYEKVHS